MAYREDLESQAASLERDVWAALEQRNAQQVEDLTRGIDRFPIAWRARRRLDLARVAALVHLDRRPQAVKTLREAVEVHLKVDLLSELEKEPLLAPVEEAWDVIRQELKRKKLRPIVGLMVLAGFIFVLSGLLSLVGDDFVLSCTRSPTQPKEANCQIARYWLGSVRERTAVERVVAADSYRAGGSSGERMFLKTAAGEKVDVHPNSMGGDGEKAASFNAWLKAPNEKKHVERWDLAFIALLSLAVAAASLLILLFGGFRWLMLTLEPPR